MTFPVLNKPYKFVHYDFTYKVIFREDKGEYFSYDSESLSPSQRIFPLERWSKFYLQMDESKFTPMFRITSIEDDPEYRDLFI